MEPRTLHVPTAIGVALLTAALANVAQFGALELETGDQYEAVRIKQGHDLQALVDGHFGSTQERFALYLALREVAAGAVLHLPPRTGLQFDELQGMALVAELRSVDALPVLEPSVAERLGLDGAVFASGVDENVGAWSVAAVDDDVAEVVVLRVGDRTYLVDARLLPDGEVPS